MTRAELMALAELLLTTAGDNIGKAAAAAAAAGELFSPTEVITLAGVQAQLATAAIDLARLK